MAPMEIVTWPNPILDTPGDPITEFNDELKILVGDMFETMYAAPGVGLAAPQVGVSKRLFVMDCSGGKDPDQRVVMINPEIIYVEGEQNGEEGCLSFPGIFTPVERSLRAEVRGFEAGQWMADPDAWLDPIHPDDRDRWQVQFARTINAAGTDLAMEELVLAYQRELGASRFLMALNFAAAPRRAR